MAILSVSVLVLEYRNEFDEFNENLQSLPSMDVSERSTNLDLSLSHFKSVQFFVDNYIRPDDNHFNINATKSDKISIARNISDTRPDVCKNMPYRLPELPKASVIIPFYNEALSVLIRTVVSILQRSPHELLNEIILIDDKSSYKYLQTRLDSIVKLLPKVRLIRNAKREGLIRSRLLGADIAEGPVLIFLDAHIECNVGWLEPILKEIATNQQRVVQPFVDGININTLEYAAPKHYHKGGFSWDLR